MRKRNFDNNSNMITFNELDFNKFKKQYIQIKKAYKDLQYSKLQNCLKSYIYAH
jgi:hypothetical protein